MWSTRGTLACFDKRRGTRSVDLSWCACPQALQTVPALHIANCLQTDGELLCLSVAHVPHAIAGLPIKRRCLTSRAAGFQGKLQPTGTFLLVYFRPSCARCGTPRRLLGLPARCLSSWQQQFLFNSGFVATPYIGCQAACCSRFSLPDSTAAHLHPENT